ncbi:MAG: hypothetical protein ABI886_09755 [Betaproteobacteria bacterium]
MLTYSIPVVVKGYAIVKYPQGKAAGDCTGGLPRDAENEDLLNTPFICGARMQECTVELAGQARIAD